MRKTLMIAVIVVLLWPVVLSAAQSRKSGDTEGRRTEATKRDVSPPAKPDRHPVPASTAPTPRPPRPHGGGFDPGVIHRPDSPPMPVHRPPVSPQPYNRPGWHDNHFSYPSPGRAYSQPPLRNWGGRPDWDDHHWSGGWGWGPTWGWGLGYVRPYPRDILVPLPYPVPGPTVYYPVPPTEYAPEYAPTPVPAEGVPAAAPEDLPLLGCDIVAGDGTFLGVIDREYESPQSIANRNSDFGSPASPTSIWNPKSLYGSPNGQYSPWNPRASHPPMLSWHGAFKGYLTTNPDVRPAIAPDTLSEVIKASPWR